MMSRRTLALALSGIAGLCLVGLLVLVLLNHVGARASSPTRVVPPAIIAVATPIATPIPSPTATPTPTPTPTPSPSPTSKPSPTPIVYHSTLTGARMSGPPPRPIAVQIDNSPAARWQTGLVDADLVYETPTEAQLTRFTAFFQTKAPAVVGPVRSARLINLQVIPEHDAILAYSGASIGTNKRLHQSGIPLMAVDANGNAAAAGWRDDSRYAPYNLYTSIAKLRQLSSKFGWARPTTAASLQFGSVAVPGVKSSGVSIPYSTGTAEFRYNPGTHTYDRFEAGAPHVDAVTGKQISPRNVVVLFTTFTQTGIVEDTLGELSLDVQLQGSGKAWVFRDGKRYTVQWHRQGPKNVLSFTDEATGKPVPLAQGQTWICLVPQWLTATPNP